MTRMSIVLLLAISFSLGCTSDQLGFRSTYRDRNVTPWASPQPASNHPPVAGQPGVPMGQQPVQVGQSVILPHASVSNLAFGQQQRSGFNSPYPMLASAGAEIDGRQFPYLNREAKLPGAGGARAISRMPRSTAISGGLAGSPQEDLRFRGGHTIKDLKFVNIYVGDKAAWDPTDVANIDKALAAAMSDQKLNNVIVQYFNKQPVSAQFIKSYFYGWKPKIAQKVDVDAQIRNLDSQQAFEGYDLPNTVFNFMLPRGAILGDPSGGAQQHVSNKAIPLADAQDSTGGLGGYHGSVHVNGKTVYYSIGAYSEKLPNGGTNGIPVFDQNWKNVVATFYHELQEARTDADVDDAATRGMGVLGWTSDTGNEIGDYPIAEAQALRQVFQEVPLADGSGMVPVQFCYSNVVHGPEGPIDYPHGMEGSGLPSNQPPHNQPPSNSSPNNVPSASVPPELNNLISNWGQMEDYIKRAILKLAS